MFMMCFYIFISDFQFVSSCNSQWMSLSTWHTSFMMKLPCQSW